MQKKKNHAMFSFSQFWLSLTEKDAPNDCISWRSYWATLFKPRNDRTFGILIQCCSDDDDDDDDDDDGDDDEWSPSNFSLWYHNMI